MTKKQKDIIIANPMYDVVFKHLMADNDTARYFIGTVLGEEIIDIDFAPQEYAHEKQIQIENQTRTLNIIRLDFVATIRNNKGGIKKVLIEVQQSLKPYDIVRFRTYIGEQYKSRENIISKDDEVVQVMPIIAIYMLGFKIADTPQIAIKIKRTGIDMMDGGDVEIKNPLFEALTHDAYFIQVPHIQQEMYGDWEKCSELMKLLSVFEQNHFVDKKYSKKYPYSLTDKNIKKMVATLERIAADPKTRRAMEEEEFAALDAAFWQDIVAQKENALAQKDNALQKALAELTELRQRFGLN